MGHAYVAQATAEAQGKNEKSGSSCLTSVNMCVTYSLKVCQQTDQPDKPDLRGQTHKQGARSAARLLQNKSTVWLTQTSIIEDFSNRVEAGLNHCSF